MATSVQPTYGIIHQPNPPKAVFPDGTTVTFLQAPSRISWGFIPVMAYEDEPTAGDRLVSSSWGWQFEAKLEWDVIDTPQFLEWIQTLMANHGQDTTFKLYLSQDDAYYFNVRYSGGIEVGYLKRGGGVSYQGHSTSMQFSGTDLLDEPAPIANATLNETSERTLQGAQERLPVDSDGAIWDEFGTGGQFAEYAGSGTPGTCAAQFVSAT